MKKDVVAVVLAGGEGKRFWPIQTSKSMVQFLGKPLLVHNLNRLKRTGIADIIIVIQPQGKEIYSRLSVPGLSIHTAVQPKPNGMAGAIITAESLIQGKPCFIMNATDVVEETLYADLKNHFGSDTPVLVGRKAKQYFPGGYFVLKGYDVIGLVEKPGEGNEPSDVMNLVFDYIPDSKKLMELLRTIRSDNDDVYEQALNELLKDTKAKMLMYDGYWYPIKYPWHILDVMRKLLEGVTDFRGTNIQIGKGVVIEGPVYIGNNVKIFENSKIVGPCCIGDGTIIGNNNLIRQSHIGAGCVTGFNTDITRSYIADSCWFHSNYIGDSVIERNVSMGAGTVLANLRLDERSVYSTVKGERVDTHRDRLGAMIGRDVRIGVNTSIMPGVKIGSGSFIGAGVTLDKDVPDGKFCLGKSEYSILDNMNKSHVNKRNEFRSQLQ